LSAGAATKAKAGGIIVQPPAKAKPGKEFKLAAFPRPPALVAGFVFANTTMPQSFAMAPQTNWRFTTEVALSHTAESQNLTERDD